MGEARRSGSCFGSSRQTGAPSDPRPAGLRSAWATSPSPCRAPGQGLGQSRNARAGRCRVSELCSWLWSFHLTQRAVGCGEARNRGWQEEGACSTREGDVNASSCPCRRPVRLPGPPSPSHGLGRGEEGILRASRGHNPDRPHAWSPPRPVGLWAWPVGGPPFTLL